MHTEPHADTGRHRQAIPASQPAHAHIVRSIVEIEIKYRVLNFQLEAFERRRKREGFILKERFRFASVPEPVII